MKIALFLNKDLHANIAFHHLKEELKRHTVRVFFSEKVGSSSKKPKDLITLEFYDSDFIFTELSKYLTLNKVTTDFELFDNRFSSFPYQTCHDVNTIEFIDEMRSFQPDLFISIRFGKIFRNEIISIPKKGILNLHSAILPDYRGILGTLHALLDKKKIIGCTLHTIDNSGIDTGEIIAIRELQVKPDKSLFWHIAQLYPNGASLILNCLKNIENNIPLKKEKQNPDEGSYFSIPTENDFQRLTNMGVEVFSNSDYLEILSAQLFKELSKNQSDHFTSWLQDALSRR